MSRGLARRLRPRRLAGLLVAFAVAFAIVAPMTLGPAMGPLTAALGGAFEHRCACGMVPGTCGCPECARVEHQRLRDHAPVPYSIVRSQCEDDEVAPGFVGLPLALAAPPGFIIMEPAESTLVLPRPPEALSREETEPSTPPPRRVAA